MANRTSQTQTGGGAETKGHIPGLYSLAVGMPQTAGPDGWKWTKLSDVARLETGHTPSRKHPEYWDGDIPWIGIRDATANHGQTLVDTNQHTNDLGIDNSSARVLPKNTVCLSRTASVGYVVVMGRPMATSQDFVNWVCSERIDHQFLKYILLSENRSFASFASGTTHQTIYFPEVKGFHVCLPSIGIQRKIASILSAYDDLIENNTRRIAILEEMAQAIYREWFVNFRFPGHENVKLVDSPRGQIPEGWEVVTLKDVCVEKKGIQTGPFGSQLHQSDYTDNGTPVVMPKDIFDARISTDSIARVPDEVCNRLPRHRLEVGDTVCARRGEIGRNAFVTERESQWMCGTGCMRMRPRKTVISPRFLFDYLCTPDIVSLIAGKAAGAIMPNLNIGIMESVPILLPPRCVQLSYECLAMENLELVSTLVSKNRNLSTTRDLLLPKLISGQLDVEDLDIDVGMTAEELAEAAAG